MEVKDTKRMLLAYKLLEWAGDCDDRQQFNELPKYQRENALKEADHILERFEELPER